MKKARAKSILLVAAILITAAMALSCQQVESLLPTPTYMPPIQPEYYSKAEIADHYLKCLKRVEPRNGDTRWEAPVLASRLDRAELLRKDCVCYDKYQTVFGYPGDEPDGQDHCDQYLRGN